MGFEKIIDDLSTVLAEQLRTRGLSIILLTMMTAFFGWQTFNAQDERKAENDALKAENKELRQEFYGKIVENQQTLLSNQKDLITQVNELRNDLK